MSESIAQWAALGYILAGFIVGMVLGQFIDIRFRGKK